MPIIRIPVIKGGRSRLCPKKRNFWMCWWEVSQVQGLQGLQLMTPLMTEILDPGYTVHSLKLTEWPLKRGHFKRKVIFQQFFFRGHVGFRGSKYVIWILFVFVILLLVLFYCILFLEMYLNLRRDVPVTTKKVTSEDNIEIPETTRRN